MNQTRLSFLLPLLTFAVLTLVSAVALYSTLLGIRDPAQLPSVLIGKQAPPTILPQLTQGSTDPGASIRLTRLRGQPLLVNFFASWCAPCRAEAPALEILSKDIAIFGIAYKDRSKDTEEFLRQFGNPFETIGMDVDGRIGIRWGVYGVPETYLLDADGIVVLRHAGPLTRGIINRKIIPAIEALGS